MSRAQADPPLITKVSVDPTDKVNGKITIKWIAPDPIALDTILNPGPYRYELMRAEGINGTNFQLVPGATFSSTTFAGLTDTMAIDQNLDTRSQGYTYRMDFYTGNSTTKYGSSQTASSVFLTALPSDEASLLSWVYVVPWDNYYFEIWRSELGGQFTLVGTTFTDSFEDNDNVVNGIEYCYKIIAYGDYGLDMVPAPLLNESQESCVIPMDNVAPCSPQVAVTNICASTPGRHALYN